MPIVTEDSRRLDPRPVSAWIWVAAVSAIVLLLLLIAVLASLAVGTGSRSGTSRPSGSRPSTLLAEAQRLAGAGDKLGALMLLNRIEMEDLGTYDRHTYLALGAETAAAGADFSSAARYTERYLELGLRIHEAECGQCHSPETQLQPLRVLDLTRSARGARWAQYLKQAGVLEQRARELRAAVRTDGENLMLRLLLYHAESALGHRRATLEHLEAVARLATKEAPASPDATAR
jgi:hypothetical protein